MDNNKLKDLYSTVKKLKLLFPKAKKSHGYAGYFMDNLNSKKYLVDFENEVIKTKDSSNVYNTTPKQEILDLYKFVDEGCHWTKTYGE